MQALENISFDELISLIRGLSDTQRAQLKAEINRMENESTSDSLEEFLLSAPTFSEDQVKTIEETRKAIDQWRKN
ncbi:hypothetical protein J2Y45_000989 [Dyadobacter sp. BE34]|uniref:Uncharacterized protein n=1 Tax=Dyadobacter fermentans TaxID=94254 RepID=A0ABU1QRC6_9BACT|nr:MULTISPECIES: hypothetical protein [Dyadobacter]MDR6803719.1 hypothetical protein [Dyadobacter fermentans]MDR7041459.1 hypothetical protein [Dyadobacter sp. BE242]MDR7195863.1 hypothetical protein [Dyadobacter sp. BE34]MDR7213593.1 hypothetical protein [Dyadobacter sp. BE31]MDR7261269.1 hypothetical protein [Dyadobacter sp. BE32]